MAKRPNRRVQHGVFLIEALIAILIFSLGILGLVAMGGVAIASQGDAQYRTEAANYANEMAAEIALAMNDDPAQNDTEFNKFIHQPAGAGGPQCQFAGSTSSDPRVQNWINRMRGFPDPKTGLPGATSTSQQIRIDRGPAAHNQVVITVCWLPPSINSLAGSAMHQYTLVTYINPNEKDPT